MCTRIIRYHKAAAINVESEKCVLRHMASALCISGPLCLCTVSFVELHPSCVDGVVARVRRGGSKNESIILSLVS